MIVTNSFAGIKDKFKNIVVGMGNFDGVHVGHQKLMHMVVDRARSINGTAVVFTFNPHPLAVLDPKSDPPKLLTQKAKERIIAGLGIDVILSVPFSTEFAKINPEDFIHNVLYKELAVRGIVVGYNFTFGNRGLGCSDTLKQFAAKYNYTIDVIPAVTIEGQVVSSTLIRKLLKEGNIKKAEQLLGYKPFIEGIVISGDRRGNTLGFPTANIALDNNLVTPPNGVYSVHVQVNDDVYLGVANIGTKPTFNSGSERNLEVHLLDFKGDLYGQEVTVNFLRRLRNEQRFNSVNDLVNQIQQDIKMALIDRCY